MGSECLHSRLCSFQERIGNNLCEHHANRDFQFLHLLVFLVYLGTAWKQGQFRLYFQSLICIRMKNRLLYSVYTVVLCPINFLYKLGNGKIGILLCANICFKGWRCDLLIEYMCVMCESLDLVSSTAKRNQSILVLKGEVRAGAGFPTNPVFLAGNDELHSDYLLLLWTNSECCVYSSP